MPNITWSHAIRSILILALFLLPKTVLSQTEQWFTSDGQLTSSLINKVLYDSRGMLWVATEDGLNRYDGSKFTNYWYDPKDPNSITNNHINNLFEDNKGRIFICTHDGVQVYNPATDNFSEPLKVKGVDASSSIADVVQQPSGELWAIGNEIYQIVESDGNLILTHTDVPDEIRFIGRAAADADGNIWFAKDTYGLYRRDKDGKTHHYFGQPGDPVIVSFCTEADSTFYAGSHGKGLYRYDRAADTFTKVDLQDPNIANVQVMCPDEFGNLLIGTDGRGLKIYNKHIDWLSSSTFTNINSDKLKIHGLAKDDYGNLWVGIYQKGLVKVPKLNAFFSSFDQRARDKDIIGSCCITALVRDKEGTLWVGTDNDDIFAVDLPSRTSRHFTVGVPKTVMGLFEDSAGRLWLGSYNRGMGTIDKKTGAFKPVELKHRGIDVLNVYDFAEDRYGNIWIATMGAGIFRHNPSTGETVRINPEDLSQWVTSIDVGAKTGNIYAGTYDGFFIINPDGSTAENLLPGKIVSAIHQEPDHDDIWLGTKNGLVRIHNEEDVVKIYTTADGLPSSAIHAIEHGSDALWISTNRGLSKFNPKDETFINFNVDNGLPNNEFSRNSSFKDQDGNIYFGGINGITMFGSSDVSAPGEKLNLRVTDFFVVDQSIHAGMKSGSRTIVDVPVSEATIFKLGPDDNTFAVRINSKEFINSTQAEFYYSFDKGPWTRIQNSNPLGGGALLTFNNVASGNHSLQFKAVNGGVESDILVINVDVAAKWYATWWAKLIYIVLFLLIILVVYMHTRRRYKKKQEEVRLQHKSEINEAKLQFFTNISHEIRTPLSLVIGPLQKLIDTDSDSYRGESYKIIMRNAQRILKLVNELMDLRKIDNKLMKMHFIKVNLRTFVNDLYETFRPAAAQKGVNFTFSFTQTEHQDPIVWIDTKNFDKIVMNLLSNALKFTPAGGKINLSISTGTDPDTSGPLSHYADISVTDTGIGIPEEDKDLIFNRFFQGKNNSIGGTGIGLHLTRELVELHHGIISVENNPDGQGTRFTVRIPLGNGHLSPEELGKEDATEINNDTEEAIAYEHLPEEVLVQNFIPGNDEEGATKTNAPRKNLSVYIVEDDEEIRNYIVKTLSKYYHTTGFSNGKQALDAIHRKVPDLIVTDVMMPEMDGITLTKKIKHNINFNHIPIIILTAKTSAEDNIEAMESGATTFVTKPFNIDILKKTIDNQIEGVQRLRNVFSGKQNQEDRLDEIEVTTNDDKLMERVMKVINKNISNSDITVEMIAHEIGISRVHLHRKLKELTNQSTRNFVRNIRLQAAAKLLREKKIPVAELSDLVGFKQSNNFSTCFKEMFGMSPSAYAAQYHSTPEEPNLTDED